MFTVDENNGFEAQALVVEETSEELSITLELPLSQASALRAWLLKPASDGTNALEDSLVNATLKKLSAAIDQIEAVEDIRRELEEAGFATDGMDDSALAELGRKIGAASSRVR
ncbi:MAG TPA: hypothetical protein VJU79_04735 [Candidatus Dormibacteraeota bacterium]|jgi:hypothetical protein|nr:hypothetical protein [Candidatus Dormibacteraeota bacterium]